MSIRLKKCVLVGAILTTVFVSGCKTNQPVSHSTEYQPAAATQTAPDNHSRQERVAEFVNSMQPETASEQQQSLFGDPHPIGYFPPSDYPGKFYVGHDDF